MFQQNYNSPGMVISSPDDTSTSSDGDGNGSKNSKEKPLLAAAADMSSAHTSTLGVVMGSGSAIDIDDCYQQQYGRTGTGIQRPARASSHGHSSLCGCLGHLMILFLPLVAMAVLLALWIVLLEYDRTTLQGYQVYGDEQLGELAAIYYNAFGTDTLSTVMGLYDPYWHVSVLASVACVLVSVVTVARNFQIEVYQKRTGSRVFMKFVNYLATLLHVLAYAGLIVAVQFRSTQEVPSYAVRAHYYGILAFFGGTASYAVLHSFLLWNQAEYPTILKVLLFVLASIVVGSSLAFGIPTYAYYVSGLESETDYAESRWEWVAVFASAISMGTYVILFFVDPVDDVLAFVFCGGGFCRSKRIWVRRSKEQERQILRDQLKSVGLGHHQHQI